MQFVKMFSVFFSDIFQMLDNLVFWLMFTFILFIDLLLPDYFLMQPQYFHVLNLQLRLQTKSFLFIPILLLVFDTEEVLNLLQFLL